MAITGGPVDHRFRVHDGDPATLAAFRAATGGAALVVTSIRGDTLPYLVGAPKGDGAKIDVFTGKVKAATYTGQLADAVTATSPSVLRVFSSQLEDANGQQQLGNRYAAFDFRLNGGTWTTLTLGLLARYQLSSEIVWDITINDPTQAENGHMAFAPQQDPATGQLETIAAYLSRWPNRGCVLGGPIRGGFGPQTDRGGWEMRVQSLANATTSLEFVAGYAAPLFKRTTNIQHCSPDANAKTDPLYGHPDWMVAPQAVTFDDANGSQWRGVIVELVGIGFYVPSFGLYSGDTFDTDGQLESHLIKTIRRRGIYIWRDTYPETGAASGLPADGTAVRVRAFTAQVSDISPIYWNGHPVDLLTKLWDEAGIAYDSSAIETTRAALGSNLGIALRITAPQEMGAFLEKTIYGPFGVGVAVNDAGLLAPFASRVFSNTPPTRTITNDDVARGTTKPFDLDVTTAIRKVTFAHTKLLLPKTTYDSTTIDGFVVQDESFEWTNNEPGALGTQEVNYTVPGMVYKFDPATGKPNDAALSGYSYAIALDIFGRTGRGMRQGSTTAIRGGNADGLKLGDECLVALKQLPNHNRRLGDDNSVTARAMQVIQMTPSASGYDLVFADSGPNAQPFATLPVLTLAASSDAPRTTALITITNAATLNTAAAGARIQMATTAGATPDSGDYTDALAYAAGAIPTTAIRLPAVSAGSTLWVRARSEQPPTTRPSNYCTPVHLTLGAIPDPSALTATPVATDASQCLLAWTPGVSEVGILTDVFLRLAAEAVSSNVRRVSLMAGSALYTLDGLVAGQAYTASVQHRDAVNGNLSDLVTVTFTQMGASVTLDAPTDANGFSGSQDKRYGFPQQDGIYGLAVAATEFPGLTEFVEQVETAPNAGTYGDPISIAVVPNVQGDWTLYENVAPNDGLRRILAARHVRDGATPSAYTAGVVVTPWTSQPLGLFSQTAGTGSLLSLSFSESSDGTQEVFIVTVGAKVDTVIVHYRTVPINATGKIFDFSEGAVVNGTTDGVSTLVLRPVDGEITFSVPHPARLFLVAGRIVPYANGKEGPSWPFPVQAAPPAINVKLTGSRTGATGSVALSVSAGPSDLPGTLDVYLATITTESKILDTKPVTASPTVLNSGTDAALGNLALPSGKDSIAIRAVFTDVSGQTWDFGPLLLNRDPLPNGTVTVGNYRPAPPFVVNYDPDTDGVRITTHSGKVTTFNAAALIAAGSSVTWLATDPTDDSTSDPALIVDETRDGYLVELLGGGAWIPIWSGDLHGQLKNPPTIKVDVEPVGDGDTVNVFGTPDTQVDEQLYVHYRLGITDAALEYLMCAGAADPTPLAVTAGTRIGPSNFFRRVDGVGSPVALLAGISLTHDNIDVHQMQSIGVESGMPSAWTNVQLSLLPLPLIESVVAKFDPATNTLSAIIAGGARIGSAGVEFADNDVFSAPITASGDVTDGTQLVLTTTLSDAQLGKPWHVRATPFSASSLGGLVGKPQTSAVNVPAIVGDVQFTSVEAGGNATLTLSVDDKGGYLDQSYTDGTVTGALTAILTALGVATPVSMTTHTVVGTVHTWTLVVALDPLHPTGVDIYDHFIDGSGGLLLSTSVDSNKQADVVNATVANNGQIATVTVDWDTDTLIGSNCARYSLDGGSTWTTADVSSVLQSQFTVTRTTSKQTVLLQGKNALDSAWSDDKATVEVDASDAVTPILTITQGTVTSTVTQFTVDASNPQASGAAPTVTLTPKGCSIDLHDTGSTHVPDGTTVTIAVPMVFDANRPASTQATEATVEGDAAITGAGATQRIVKVLPQLNLGPSLTAHYEVLTSSTGRIVWSCTNGTVTLTIDNGSPATPSSSPIAITLDANPHSYLFEAVVDGQTISAPVTVPALGATAGGGLFDNLFNQVYDYATNKLLFSWTYPDASAAFDVYVSDDSAGLYNIQLTRTAAGATQIQYTPQFKVLTSGSGSGTWDVGFKVQAILPTTEGLTSIPTVATYHYV